LGGLEMSVLSNVDIQNELRKGNIRIYPLDLENIKSGTYNLNASEYAWSLSTGTKISNTVTGIITIPAHDTGLIATKEVMWTSKKICGTYHSKVSVVSLGGGHIGTTLDATWIGHSIIAVHNHTDENLELPIDETFVSVMFHYLNKPTTKTQENNASQTDKLPPLSKNDSAYFDKPWKRNADELFTKVKEDKEYIKLVEQNKNPYFINGLILILTILIIGALIYGQTIVPKDSFLFILLNFLTFAGFSGLFIPLYTYLYKK
jgi:deoxycytidine triphosphate deaminase